MLALAGGPSAQAGVFSMEASKYALQAVQEVDIYLRVSGLTGAAGDSLSAFDVDLLFDPAVFQMTGFRFEDRTTGGPSSR